MHAGTNLFYAHEDPDKYNIDVWGSALSLRVIGKLCYGDCVVASGPPVRARGQIMVPIKPQGALMVDTITSHHSPMPQAVSSPMAAATPIAAAQATNAAVTAEKAGTSTPSLLAVASAATQATTPTENGTTVRACPSAGCIGFEQTPSRSKLLPLPRPSSWLAAGLTPRSARLPCLPTMLSLATG